MKLSILSHLKCGTLFCRLEDYIYLDISRYIYIFININLFIYLWPHWVFVAVRGLSLVMVRGLLIVVASLVAEHGL